MANYSHVASFLNTPLYRIPDTVILRAGSRKTTRLRTLDATSFPGTNTTFTTLANGTHKGHSIKKGSP